MEDAYIVDLYWQHSERAIEESAAKYGRYCHSIAYNILFNAEDAEECVNDTYLGAWNSIPPHRPTVLSSFLGKITRRLSIKKWQSRNAKRRGGGEVALALEELAECVPAPCEPDREVSEHELARIIDSFAASLPEVERNVFVCRYWYLDS